MHSVILASPLLLVLLCAAVVCAALSSRTICWLGCLAATIALVLLALVQGAGLEEIAAALLLETAVCLLGEKEEGP